MPGAPNLAPPGCSATRCSPTRRWSQVLEAGTNYWVKVHGTNPGKNEWGHIRLFAGPGNRDHPAVMDLQKKEPDDPLVYFEAFDLNAYGFEVLKEVKPYIENPVKGVNFQ